MNLLLCLCLTMPMQAKDPSVADILDAWESGCDSIHSYDMELQFDNYSYIKVEQGQVVLISDHSLGRHDSSKSRIYRLGHKRRGELHLDVPRLTPTIMIEDGEKAAIIDPNRKSVMVQRGILAFGATQYEDYEVTYRALLGSTSRIGESRRRDCKLLPREGKLFVLDVPFGMSPNQSFYNFCWRFWLDPDRNFMPVRIEEWYQFNTTKVRAASIENDLAQVAPGVWAPLNSTRKTYGLGDPKEPLVGQFIGQSTLKVTGEPKFNQPLDDSLFTINLPFGYQINDQIRNIVYTKGSTDPDQFIKELSKDASAGLAKLPEAERRLPQTVFLPESWWFRNRVWLAWGAMVVLLVVASSSYRRFRRSQGGS